jgi:hypothetical protein
MGDLRRYGDLASQPDDMRTPPTRCEGKALFQTFLQVHGLAVRIRISGVTVPGRLLHLFHYFTAAEQAEADIELILQAATAPCSPCLDIPLSASATYACGGVTYSLGARRLFVDYRHLGTASVDLEKNVIVGYIIDQLVTNDAPAIDYEASFANLVLNCFAPIFRRHGIFPLHAFAAVGDGLAALLVGESGSGKTTAGLALVRAGWYFLSNDHPLLRQTDNGVDVFCYPEAVNVFDDTIRLFPELQRLADEHSAYKHGFLIEDVYPSSVVESAPARVLIFPEVAETDKSILEYVPRREALVKLLPHSLDGWDKKVLSDNFSVLSRLVETTTAYKLYLGRDLDRLPQMVSELL